MLTLCFVPTTLGFLVLPRLGRSDSGHPFPGLFFPLFTYNHWQRIPFLLV
jgi:hypothetical protein